MIFDTISKLGPIQMEVFGLGKVVWETRDAEEPDRRFRPLLDLYSCLYERLYHLVAAPLAFANALLHSSIDPRSLIEHDGRVRPKVMEDLETSRGFPRGLLTGGLERHLRNSISHGRYETLSRDVIRMEDRFPSGQISWGPHTFTYHELQDRVFQLQFTCEVLLAALIMFEVNNHQVIRERGFVSPIQRRMRPDIAKAYIEKFAEVHGFECKEVSEPGHETLMIRVTISGKRSGPAGEIFVGGEGWARKYLEDIRTEDSPIRQQAYGLLQMTLDVHDTYKVVVLEVEREDGTNVGRIVADREAREHIFDGTKSIEEICSLLTEDTLPDEMIPVIIRGIPREA